VSRAPLALVLFVCSVALCAADPVRAQDKEPKSNNKGKIVGKWKVTSGSDKKVDELKTLEMLKLFMVFEFKDDGTLLFGIDSDDAETKKRLKKETSSYTVTYTLGPGDEVELSGLAKADENKKGDGPPGKKDRQKATIKIDGDKMTITDAEKKTIELKKLPKEKADK
jgi:hypothetical protein